MLWRSALAGPASSIFTKVVQAAENWCESTASSGKSGIGREHLRRSASAKPVRVAKNPFGRDIGSGSFRGVRWWGDGAPRLGYSAAAMWTRPTLPARRRAARLAAALAASLLLVALAAACGARYSP